IIDDDGAKINSFYPLAMEPGGIITVKGTGLAAGLSVTIGSAVIPQANVIRDNNSQIRVVIPNNISGNLNGPISININGQTVSTANFLLTAFNLNPASIRTSPDFVLLGDVNQDGVINIVDLVRLQLHINNAKPLTTFSQLLAADVTGSSARNGDGSFGD